MTDYLAIAQEYTELHGGKASALADLLAKVARAAVPMTEERARERSCLADIIDAWKVWPGAAVPSATVKAMVLVHEALYRARYISPGDVTPDGEALSAARGGDVPAGEACRFEASTLVPHTCCNCGRTRPEHADPARPTGEPATLTREEAHARLLALGLTAGEAGVALRAAREYARNGVAAARRSAERANCPTPEPAAEGVEAGAFETLRSAIERLTSEDDENDPCPVEALYNDVQDLVTGGQLEEDHDALIDDYRLRIGTLRSAWAGYRRALSAPAGKRDAAERGEDLAACDTPPVDYGHARSIVKGALRRSCGMTEDAQVDFVARKVVELVEYDRRALSAPTRPGEDIGKAIADDIAAALRDGETLTRSQFRKVVGDVVARYMRTIRPVTPSDEQSAAAGEDIDPEDLWTDYRTEREHLGPADRVVFLAGVDAGRRTAVDATRPLAPANEDERAQAERWALHVGRESCVTFTPDQFARMRTAMLPLVREARRYPGESEARLLDAYKRATAELAEARREIERLRATPAPLTKERTTGLYRKFDVRRADGSSASGGKHERCDYLVLDWQHDPFAVPAGRAYADACESEYPALAADIRTRADAASRGDIPAEVRPKQCVDFTGYSGGVYGPQPGDRCVACHRPRSEHEVRRPDVPDLTPEETAEVITSAPGQIGPGQTPIGREPAVASAVERGTKGGS